MDTEAPPRKRLLTNPNPKPSFITVSPESTVSSDSSSDRLTKKTRELPNLSDCHSCSVRINYTNPRERLQPLDSMWRIVLLCKKCFYRVKSSDICSYCFSVVNDENDCFKCCDCKRCIHNDCVEKYGSRNDVCIDCWIPDAIASSIRARCRKSRRKKLKNVELCEQESNERSSLLGEEVRRKVVAAAKASEIALRKAVVAKNAVGLAKGVLDVVAGIKGAGSCDKEVKVVDDVELAFMLHRAINSSPRTSTYACLMSSLRGDDAQLACYSRRRARKKIILVKSSSLDIPLICYSRRCKKGGLKNSGSFSAPLVCYSRRRKKGGSKNSVFLNAPLQCYSRRGSSRKHDRDCVCYICELGKSIDKHVSLSSVCLKASNCGSNSENSLNGNECQENDTGRINLKPNRYMLKYCRIGKGTRRPSIFVKDHDCGSCMDSDNLNAEDLTDARVFGNGDRCLEISENHDDSTKRFLLKYKRSSRSKLGICCKVEETSPLLPSNHPAECTTLSDSRTRSSSQGEL